MPIKSEAQRRFLWAKDPVMAQKWEDHTPPGALPEKKGKASGKRKKAKKSKKASPRRRKNVSRRSKRRQKAH